jgi:shikimate kinase
MNHSCKKNMSPGKSPNGNVILCGFMATGKSAVGKRLASLMGYDFLDMDAVIEEEAGLSIREIFAARGEPAFRALESEMVERLAARTGCVIATGGGAIVNPRNLEAFKRCGTVITLTADPQTILSRVGSGEDRPMLAGGDKTERIAFLMQERAHAYGQADIIVDTSSLSIDEAAQYIIASLERGSGQ